jgi:hypothetical protein
MKLNEQQMEAKARFPVRIDRRDQPAYLWDVHGLRISKSHLAKMAVDGSGPPYARFGQACLSTQDDLDDWVADRLGLPATSYFEHLANANKQPAA